MIDPNFDPLEHLEICEIEILKLKHDVRILIDRTETLTQAVNKLRQDCDQNSTMLRVLRREVSDLTKIISLGTK